MRLRHAFLVMLALVLASAVYPQRPSDDLAERDLSRVVKNEDQGNAFIITNNTGSPLSLIPERAAKPVGQYSIFLGRGWSSDDLHRQEPMLSNLLANMSGAEALIDRGVKNAFSANGYQENPRKLGKDPITDLKIQKILAGMIENDPALTPNEPIVFVVYLDPAIESTLAGMSAGKHYLAYANAFNASGQNIRYVVVPMNVNPTYAYSTALTAFLHAAFQ